MYTSRGTHQIEQTAAAPQYIHVASALRHLSACCRGAMDFIDWVIVFTLVSVIIGGARALSIRRDPTDLSQVYT